MSKTLRNVLTLFACLVLFACLTPAAFADDITVSTLDELWDAIERHSNIITLTGDITINADWDNRLFDARDDEVTIPYGVTLTVSGEGNYEGGIEIGTLTLGGTVAVNEGGIIRVNDKLNVQEGAQVQANGGFNLFPAADILPDHTDVFSFGDESDKTNLLFKPTTDDDFSQTVSVANELADHFVADINFLEPVTLTGEHILTHETELRVNGGAGASLTLNEGAVLKYDGCGGSVFFMNNGEASPDGVFYVRGDLNVNAISIEPGCKLVVAPSGKVSTGEAGIDGTLENGGFVELRQRGSSSDPCMIVTDTGTYYGDGAIGVMDPNNPDSYFSGVALEPYKKISDNVETRYIPADLVLPLDLTSIESEAFADGTFDSVYIPAGVTTIEEDAFGDRTELTVYGEPGKYAQSYADDAGFTFIRTA